MIRRYAVTGILALVAAIGVDGRARVGARPQDGREQSTATARDQGSTRAVLPDGRVLIAGGEGTETRAVIWNLQTGATTPTANQIQAPRAWHTATVLPDGTVLLVGGRHGNTLVGAPEIFDPATEIFSLIPVSGAVPRASHTATVLTDGRVLVAGGTDGGPAELPTEIWNVNDQTVTAIPGAVIARSGHTATLAGDGRVMIAGGIRRDGTRPSEMLALDPLRGTAVD